MYPSLANTFLEEQLEYNFFRRGAGIYSQRWKLRNIIFNWLFKDHMTRKLLHFQPKYLDISFTILSKRIYPLMFFLICLHSNWRIKWKSWKISNLLIHIHWGREERITFTIVMEGNFWTLFKTLIKRTSFECKIISRNDVFRYQI